MLELGQQTSFTTFCSRDGPLDEQPEVSLENDHANKIGDNLKLIARFKFYKIILQSCITFKINQYIGIIRWAIVSLSNQISNFSSNSQMAIHLGSLSSMVHLFNHVKELELSQNGAKASQSLLHIFPTVISNLRL